jgi:hypothetical protein
MVKGSRLAAHVLIRSWGDLYRFTVLSTFSAAVGQLTAMTWSSVRSALFGGLRFSAWSGTE